MQHTTGFGLGTGEVKRRPILPKALVVECRLRCDTGAVTIIGSVTVAR